MRVNLQKAAELSVELRIDVQDNGPGIPADRMDRLFKSFSQVDASTTRKHGGTGLGLAISRQLTELMGGQIGVESQAGQGARFWFTLMLEKGQAPADAQTISAQAIRGKRILVIDDNATDRELFCAYLNTWGCRFDSAANSRAGLEKLREAAANDPFDAVLMDFMMPEISGDRLGEMIKSDPATCKTALIIITSRGWRGDGQRMKKIGFEGYLTKPIKRHHLLQCLLQVIDRRPGSTAEPDTQGPMVTRHTIDAVAPTQQRLLVVEDNPVNQKVAVLLLKKMGYHADVATNGQEAVDLLAQTSYDLVLMDQQMPVMDGLQATRTIRSSSAVSNNKITIVAMTANALKGDRERCLDAGMDDYISKPIDPDNFQRILQKWLHTESNPRQTDATHHQA